MSRSKRTAPTTSAPVCDTPSQTDIVGGATADIAPAKVAPSTVIDLTNGTKSAQAANVGWSVAGQDETTVAALHAIATSPAAIKEFRAVFMAGYAARVIAGPSATLTPETIAAGSVCMRKANVKADNPNGAGQRTASEEKIYDNARKAWERVLRTAGLAAVDPRGGARDRSAPVTAKKVKIVAPAPTDRTTADASTSKPLAPVNGPAVPKFTKPAELAEFYAGHVAMMRATLEVSKRATHPALVAFVNDVDVCVARMLRELSA